MIAVVLSLAACGGDQDEVPAQSASVVVAVEPHPDESDTTRIHPEDAIAPSIDASADKSAGAMADVRPDESDAAQVNTTDAIEPSGDALVSTSASDSVESESTTNGYLSLKNAETGGNQCLALHPNDTTVAFAACMNQPSQGWVFVKDGRYFRIHNARADLEGKKLCLRAYSSSAVKMDACSGDGYTSMRQWTVIPNLDGSISLRNKYRSDLGRDEMLAASPASLATAMGAATDDAVNKWFFDGTIPSPSRPVIGSKSILLLVTHFSGDNPVAAEPVRKAVFGDGEDYSSLRHYLQLASRGKLRISGTMLSGLDIGERPATCDSTALLNAARSAARASGVEPGSFDYLFVETSGMTACNWAGLAASPGNWILSNRSGHKYWMWTHEFGHNLGASHPNSRTACPESGSEIRLGSACTSGGIDDPSDTVGGGGRRLYPVDYHLYAGWLSDDEVPVIREPGTYRLAPLWQEGRAQGYRILRSDGSWLLLEFRQPGIKFEDWAPTDPFVSGVIVREMRYRNSNIHNYLVDTTPATSSMKDAPLTPNRSLYDELSGKRLTVKSVDSQGAVIVLENVTS